MTRLILLILLGLVATYYFPDSRQMLLDATEPIVVPAVRWAAKEEMGQVGEDALEHERLTGQIPDRRAWVPWLEYRYPAAEARRDPWGSTYQIRVFADSVWIVSWGPDRERATGDDFHVTRPRERRRGR